MAYDMTTYVNDTTPAISAENLNKSEQGIQDAPVRADLYSRNIDTDLTLTQKFEQGGWTDIANYSSPSPNTSSIRIRCAFSINAKKVHVKSLNANYTFACVAFDSNHTVVEPKSQAVTASEITVKTNGTLTLLRIAIKRTNDSYIIPVESENIAITIDDKPYSLSQLCSRLDTLDSEVLDLDKFVYGYNYTDHVDWVQGGYGAIANYSSPNANESSIRIRSEFITNDGRKLIIKRTNTSYDFIYACFTSNGTLLDSSSSWQTETKYLDYTNIYLVRVSIRKHDDTSIVPAAYPTSGVSVNCDSLMPESASFPTKLTVMTYNIGRFSYGVSPYYLSEDYAEKLANYKRFFSEKQCDIVGLQEQNVYLDGATSGSVLANSAIFNYLYPYNMDSDNWTCIKSKFPLKNKGSGSFTASNRTYVYATTKVDGKDIFLMCVHTTPNEGETEEAKRIAEVQEIISIVSGKEYFIVFGDFNALSTSLYDYFLNAGFHIANGGYLPFEVTYPHSEGYSLDNIVTSSNIIVDFSAAQDVYDDLSSDHIPFIANLTVN